MSDKNKLQLQFGIKEIKIINFSLNNSIEIQELPSDHPYTFEINASPNFNKIDKIIGVVFNVKIFVTPKKEKNVCKLSLLMNFHILNFDKVVIEEGENIMVPDPVMHHLIALTLSTTRGVLFDKLQGSFLSKIILPIIDVTKLTKNKIES